MRALKNLNSRSISSQTERPGYYSATLRFSTCCLRNGETTRRKQGSKSDVGLQPGHTHTHTHTHRVTALTPSVRSHQLLASSAALIHTVLNPCCFTTRGRRQTDGERREERGEGGERRRRRAAAAALNQATQNKHEDLLLALSI